MSQTKTCAKCGEEKSRCSDFEWFDAVCMVCRIKYPRPVDWPRKKPDPYARQQRPLTKKKGESGWQRVARERREAGLHSDPIFAND